MATDPFSDKFDSLTALNSILESEDQIPCCSSVEEWEEKFLLNNPDLVNKLKDYDRNLEKELKPMGIGANARIRRLREDNKANVLRKWEEGILEQGVTHINKVGFVFGLTEQCQRFVDLIRRRAKVSIKIRATKKGDSVRTVQGVIEFADSHLNLMVRNVTEVVCPTNLHWDPKFPWENYKQLDYSKVEGEPNTYSRRLPNMMIAGKSIVSIEE